MSASAKQTIQDERVPAFRRALAGQLGDFEKQNAA